jgi:hypothetical protein
MGSEYQLQETINGVTFTYFERSQDPTVSETAGRTMKEGDYEDYFLWADGDATQTHVVMDLDAGDEKLKILARASKNDWWKYKIKVDSQTFRRRKKNDADWSPPQPVTKLRIKINEAGEVAHPVSRIDLGGPEGDFAVITHPGSTCTVIWNPATRRYQRVC